MFYALETPTKNQPIHGMEVLSVQTENKPNVVEASVNNAKRDTTRFSYEDGTFVTTPVGIFYETKIDKSVKRAHVCGPLRIVAETRNEKSNEWGRLLEWPDRDKKTHRWAMPMEMLKESGVDMRGELMNQGLSISADKKVRNLLSIYIQMCPTDKKAICVNRLGWHGGVYVLPDSVIGKTDEITVFQHGAYIDPAFSQSGTLDEWQEHIAKQAAGNSRLVFAINVALASSLIEMMGMESGGFHLRGLSSSGKTTAMHVAASVFGHPNKYVRQWRTTANGLEGIAAIHNDGLLILDEISQVDSKSAGEVAYMLANGQGKTRANRYGMAREPFTWRLLFLSTGEESLSAIMNKSGGKSNAGQEVRMADIESDAGAGMGLFETLHGMKNPANFALVLKDNAALYHGTVGLAWIEKLVAERKDLPEQIKKHIDTFVAKAVPKHAGGQIWRVARRFALIACAGELATEWGLTGWEQYEAAKATLICFNAWLDKFGLDNQETRALLEQVRAFIEQHGASRFGRMDGEDERVILNRAGFVRVVDEKTGEMDYLILPEVFRKEVCKGFDPTTAVRILYEQGCLKKSSDGYQTVLRIKALGKIARVYVLTNQIIA